MAGCVQLRVGCTRGGGGAARAATQQKGRLEGGSWCVWCVWAALVDASSLRVRALFGVQGLGHEFDYPYPVWVKGGALAPPQGLDSGPRMAKGLQVSCGFNHSAAIVQY